MDHHFEVGNYYKYVSDYRAFPTLNFATVLTNGTTLQMNLNNGYLRIEKELLKLPKSRKYHGYSDSKGVLYFFDGFLERPVTKYHFSINKKGHKTIPNSEFHTKNDYYSMSYTKSIEMGPIIWFLGFESPPLELHNYFCNASRIRFDDCFL